MSLSLNTSRLVPSLFAITLLASSPVGQASAQSSFNTSPETGSFLTPIGLIPGKDFSYKKLKKIRKISCRPEINGFKVQGFECNELNIQKLGKISCAKIGEKWIPGQVTVKHFKPMAAKFHFIKKKLKVKISIGAPDIKGQIDKLKQKKKQMKKQLQENIEACQQLENTNIVIPGTETPATPEYPVPGEETKESYKVAQFGNVFITASGRAGVKFYQVPLDLGEPELIATVDTPGSATDVAVVDNGFFSFPALLVADGFHGLTVVSLLDLRNPEVLGSLDLFDKATAVTYHGKKAYVTISGSGLAVVDCSNPYDPQLEQIIETGGVAKDVKVIDRKPTAFTPLSGIGLPPLPGGSFLPGADSGPRRLAYVANNHNVTVVDVTPFIGQGVIQKIDTDGTQALALDDTFFGGHSMFTADFAGGITKWNLDHPLGAIPVGTVDVPGYALDVAIIDDAIFVTSTEDGVHSLDTRWGIPLGVDSVKGTAYGVTAVEGPLRLFYKAAVADNLHGLTLIRR